MAVFSENMTEDEEYGVNRSGRLKQSGVKSKNVYVIFNF